MATALKQDDLALAMRLIDDEARLCGADFERLCWTLKTVDRHRDGRASSATVLPFSAPNRRRVFASATPFARLAAEFAEPSGYGAPLF